MKKTDASCRGFRWLMRLYPRAYRRQYAQEMEDFFRREWAADGGGVAFWVRLTVDHVRAAWRVWRRSTGLGGGGRIGDDLVAAGRTLRRSPGFAVFAMVTLALGVGATTGVFTVLDRVVLRPLPYEGADRLLLVGMAFRLEPDEIGSLSPAFMAALEESPGPAERVAGVGAATMILSTGGDPERVPVRRVTTEYFPIFGAQAAVGRLFTSDDYVSGGPKVAVLAYASWVERYGSEPGVVGSTVALNGEAHTVVGVLSRSFIALDRIGGSGEVWVPYRVREGEPARGIFFIDAVARLRPGASRADMNAHLKRLSAEIYPPGDGPNFLSGAASRDLQGAVVGDIGSTLGKVLAAVALLLLISCVNVANLLLVRGAERRREFAVRSALGAGTGRLVRQLLCESAFLAAGGAALGGALALGALELFRRYAPGGIPRLAEATLDARGLVFSIALSAATVLFFGLVPAMRAASRGGTAAGSLGQHSTTGRREGRLRGGLVAGETALAVILVVGSGLLAHDLIRLATEDAGFRSDGLVSMRVSLRGDLGARDYDAWRSFWSEMLESAEALPGASAVALTSELPYTRDGIRSRFTPQGHEADEEGSWIPVVLMAGDYFGTMGIRLMGGRSFTESELAGEARSIVVNEAFVREYWPGQDWSVLRVKEGAPDVEDEGWYDVVGVAADVRTQAGAEARPTVYLPMNLDPGRTMDVVVRTEGSAAAMAPALREMLRRLDPGLPVTRISTVEALAFASLARPRFYAALFSGFAGVALLLAVVGVYGTTAYVTRSRTREIGIRLALGARRSRVVRAMVGRTGSVVLAGVVVGLGTAAWGSMFLSGTLLHVEPRDPLTYGLVGALVLSVGVVAAWLPAQQVSRVDPASTLREDG